jgi:hypothetical protein
MLAENHIGGEPPGGHHASVGKKNGFLLSCSIDDGQIHLGNVVVDGNHGGVRHRLGHGRNDRVADGITRGWVFA